MTEQHISRSKLSKKKTGRKERVFSTNEVDSITQMALDNCHVDTIALALSIPKQTLVRRFGTFISQKRAEGRTMLRRAQREKAINSHDTGMLCFLGKNELDQTDKRDIEVSGTVKHEIINFSDVKITPNNSNGS